MTRSALIRAAIFFAASSILAPSRRAEAQFQYPVKVVIGRSDGTVAAKGTYFTAINVHNTAPERVAQFSKRFVQARPKEDSEGPISPTTRGSIPRDRAMEIDTADIWGHTRTPRGSWWKGFAIIESDVELDVVAVYTVANDSGQVVSIFMERVAPRRR
jgi:hypothetical protein